MTNAQAHRIHQARSSATISKRKEKNTLRIISKSKRNDVCSRASNTADTEETRLQPDLLSGFIELEGDIHPDRGWSFSPQ